MKRILVVRTDRLGDVILSSPVFRALREEYPDGYIAVMVRPYTKDCVQGNPYINEVIVYDKYGEDKGILGSLKFISELRSKRFELAVILHPTNRVNLITFLAGIPERVGYNRKFGALLTRRVPHKKQLGEKHEREYTLDILRAIGLEPRSRALYMPIERRVQEKMDGMLAGLAVGADDMLIALHPSSSCPSKRWMAGRFAGVSDELVRRYKAKIILVAGTDGVCDADEVKRRMVHKPIDLSGKISVPELASVLKRCSLFISNDSGPVHVASDVGTPVVVIFARKDKGLGPKRWGPTNKYDIVLHKDAGCDRCLAHNCDKGFLCLKAISEADVIRAAESILRRRPS